MLNPLSVLSLQLACQLLSSKNYSSLIDVYNTSTPLITSVAELPNGYTVFPEIGVAYKYHQPRQQVSWYAARRYCEAEGDNLAIIDSIKKVEYLTSFVPSGSDMWVGIHRFFGDDEWASVAYGFLGTSLPWRYDSKRVESSYKCVKVSIDSNQGLYVYECSTSSNFICEVSLFKDEGLNMLTRSPQPN